MLRDSYDNVSLEPDIVMSRLQTRGTNKLDENIYYVR